MLNSRGEGFAVFSSGESYTCCVALKGLLVDLLRHSKAELLQLVAVVAHLKEVPEIHPRKPLRAFRSALWHFRQGGISQLRQWGTRKLGITYAINYATALHENQRQIQAEVEELKQNYSEELRNTEESQKESLKSVEQHYQEKLEAIQAEHSVVEGRLREEQKRLFTSLRSDHETGLKRLEEAYKSKIGKLEADNEEALAAQRKELEELRADLKRTDKSLEKVTQENRRMKARIFSSASLSGLSPELEVASDEFRPLISELLALEHTLPLVSLVEATSSLQSLNLTELRQLGRAMNTAGYWKLLARVQENIFEKSKKDSDERALKRTYSTLSAFETPLEAIETESTNAYDPSGPVIHVVGKGLLDAQTGYTLRTAYTVRAQQQLGIPTLVALQPGSSGVEVKSIDRAVFNKVSYVRLPGSARGRTFLKPWLDTFVEGLEELVQEERPSVLHAHSDFLNGAATVIVGRRNNIPVIYESRGFWEESWLSRLGDKLGLGIEPREALEPYGLPDAYSLRRRAELLVREGADAVITLADVMQDHIQQEHEPAELSSLHVVPNAVEPEEFVPRSPDSELADELGIADDAVVIGYVSSIVEYEGIDILLSAFANLQKSAPELKAHVLLVGDGPVLERLKELAIELGIEEFVTFTGQVPHEEVGRYYSLIDIFVIPRRPTTVSQLVTPLKPFEAMSMGKAVVVSDVSALQEIVDKSQAAETFIPNDPLDLARVLHDLVVNDDRRKELGTAGRSWVEKHRSWESNAEKTREIYRGMGAEWLHILKGSATDWVGEIARHLRKNPPPTSGWFVLGKPKDQPEVIMNEGWRYENFPRIRLQDAVDWEKYPKLNRSLAFWLQGWLFVDAFLANDRVPSEMEVIYLVDVVRKWNDARIARLETSEPDESMTYYDMSLALRVPRLLALIAQAERFEETRHDLAWLVALLLNERQELRKTEAFTPRTNHGFYTAASQLHLEKSLPELPDHKSVLKQATERMNLLIQSQFASDGGHLEHSPTYHRLLLISFIAAADQGLIDDPEMRTRLTRAQEVLGWMVQPNGELVALGDTEGARLSAKNVINQASSDWIITDGELGTPSTAEMLVLRESGYVFVRSPQPQQPRTRLDSSYLAFQGGFHSRTHKHADELSFVWFDRRQEILVDAGRWGYGPLLDPDSPLRSDGFYYAAPERQYVESVRGHNTIEVDGKIHDRRRRPYGSALIDAWQEDGSFGIKAEAPHGDYVHRRELTLRPGKRLEVIDLLDSSLEEPRVGSSWFLLNGDFELISHAENEVRFRMAHGETLVMESDRTILSPVRGDESRLIGWRSTKTYSLEPAWSINIQHEFINKGSSKVRFSILT